MRATRSGITGLNRFSRPRDDSRRFYAARNVAVFRRDSFTRDAKLAVPSFSFRSLPGRRGRYPRRAPVRELDRRPAAPFSWGGLACTRDLTFPVTRTHPCERAPLARCGATRELPSPEPRPVRRAPTFQPTPSDEPAFFRRARAARAAHGLGARHLLLETPSIGRQSWFCQEPLRRGQRVRPITPQLQHPFTHRSGPLRHELTGLPRRADPSPFRVVPAAAGFAAAFAPCPRRAPLERASSVASPPFPTAPR